MDAAFGGWLSLAWAVVLMLVAAKSHGRQVRLERERAGFRDVDFRRDDNPPFVEQLWARDRRGFWGLGLAAALALLALTFSVQPAEPLPAALAALAIAAALAFGVQGVRSWLRAERAGGLGNEARLGSAGWWALALGLGLAWLVAGLSASLVP